MRDIRTTCILGLVFTVAVMACPACGGGGGGGSDSGSTSDAGGSGGLEVVDQSDANGSTDDAGPSGGTDASGGGDDHPCQSDSECQGAFGELAVCTVAWCDLTASRCLLAPAVDGTKCDDGVPCTDQDACKLGACAGVDVTCDDANVCTDGLCDKETGECSYTANEAPCDDGQLCTVEDRCDEGLCIGGANPVCACVSDEDCAPFDDGDLCNGTLTCQVGQCVAAANSAVTCDPGIAGPCQTAGCDPKTGLCDTFPDANGTACDDADPCTKADHCAAGVCDGAAVVCNDNNICTDDTCQTGAGCVYSAIDVACDDGDLCTVGDSCVAGQCAGTDNPECDCSSDADCAEFEDGNLCNGTLQCAGGSCVLDAESVVTCTASAAACQDVLCQPTTGQCETKNALDGQPCSDGSDCTVSDHCTAGSCVGSALVCDDGEDCTQDTCDQAGGCKSTALTGAECDDGNACTAGDLCTSGSCEGTPSPGCDCTTTSDCAELEDGDLCNGTLQCVGGACVVNSSTVVVCPGASDPCTDSFCSPQSGKCGASALPDGTQCSDGDSCTHDDHCVGGVCQGPANNCDDGDLCTDDACDPLIGCYYQYSGNLCDDGNSCTVFDACFLGLCLGIAIEDCVCSTSADCDSFDDGDKCNGTLVCSNNKCVTSPDTVVTCAAATDPECGSAWCNPSTGQCQVLADSDGKPCDDGDLCTTFDVCDGGQCDGLSEVDCSDGNPCTHDLCEPTFGCWYPASDGVSCDDGDPCTVGDECDGGACLPGESNTCAGGCEPKYTLTCGQNDTWDTGSFGATDQVDDWGCTAVSHPGPEYTYTFTAPYDGLMNATLSSEEALTNVLIVSQGSGGCEPSQCQDWGYTIAGAEMTAGETLYIVVDGMTADSGGYSINVDCVPDSETDCTDGVDEDGDGSTDCSDSDCGGDDACGVSSCIPAWTLGCGSVDYSATYAGGSTNAETTYPSCNPFDYPADEYTYAFTAPSSGEVSVALSNTSVDVDVMVLADTDGSCSASQCVAWGDSAVSFDAVAGQTYYLVVDGYNGAQGSFTIDLVCESAAPTTESACTGGVDDDGDGQTDCEDSDCLGTSPDCQPACTPDNNSASFLTCPSDQDAWNNGGSGSTNIIESYSCVPWGYPGPEYIYTYTATTTGPVTVSETDDTDNLDLLVLENKGLGCNPASCVDWHGDTVTWDAVAGTTYYIVVEGYQGTSADYQLQFTCGD